MSDLVQWIKAQLDEDERIARAATAGPWRAHDTHLGQYGHAATILSGDGNDIDLRAWLPSMSNEPWDEKRNVWADAAHIAAHDPARVLREVETVRRIVGLHVITVEKADLPPFDSYTGERNPDEYNVTCAICGWVSDEPTSACLTLRLLALPYADRDSYRPEWAPTE